ncbi:Biotin-requiring enzyme [Tistlia consotensis]|uniref:Biotin-requiring enzyme n=1 Tax=Tistlia consotensis USBA 355 TaxID=560819 RepID=A0A1Y6BF47_9PROT|nr:biotin/lipoyl-containing protein [Tistlia consotensis]SMF04442.1 Biotin-requiring enzyme [Tistlia consotensis USBA 355]SNR54477.1 Biotin-requiring enzyme [Tistlia consotensis]
MALALLLGAEAAGIEIVRRRPHLVVRIDGREHEVVERDEADGRTRIELDGRPLALACAADGNTRFLRLGGRNLRVSLVDPRDAAAAGEGGGDEIRAPMPGSVVTLHKAEGEAVLRGETILTIESMKLQTALVSPRDGVVELLLRGEGQTFDKDEVVVRLASPSAPGPSEPAPPEPATAEASPAADAKGAA